MKINIFILLIIALTSCNKNKLKEIPVEFVGTWQWEYTLVYHNGILIDSVYNDYLYFITIDSRKASFLKNNFELFKLTKKDLVSRNISDFANNYLVLLKDKPTDSPKFNLNLLIDLNTNQFFSPQFPCYSYSSNLNNNISVSKAHPYVAESLFYNYADSLETKNFFKLIP
jgi:hypothetical protein